MGSCISAPCYRPCQSPLLIIPCAQCLETLDDPASPLVFFLVLWPTDQAAGFRNISRMHAVPLGRKVHQVTRRPCISRHEPRGPTCAESRYIYWQIAHEILPGLSLPSPAHLISCDVPIGRACLPTSEIYGLLMASWGWGTASSRGLMQLEK